MSGFWDRLMRAIGNGGRPPAGFPGTLDPDEWVVAVADLAGGGHLVLTQVGVWVPEGSFARRVGWHLVSKAVWDRSSLLLTEAVTTGSAGAAMLIADLPPRRFVLTEAGQVPDVVRHRVTGSILSSQYYELPGGGAWFVQRKVAGQDGVVLQVRPDEGTSPEAVHTLASGVAERLGGSDSSE